MNQAMVKHFKLSVDEVAKIQSTLQPHQSLLEVLFEKNMVDPVAYIAWAKDHFSLPVLKPAFLEQNNNVDMLLDRYKNVFPKNVIPFHEMDGVLYVMCLEPTPFEAPQAIQYVLAPWDIISQYAVKNETSVVVKAAEEVPHVKEETNPLFKDLGASTPSKIDEFNFQDLAVKDGESSQPADPSDIGEVKLEEKDEIPAGLDFPPNPTGEESFVSDQPVTSVDLNSFKFEGLVPVKDEPKGETKLTGTVVSANDVIAKHPPKPKQASAPQPPPDTAPVPTAAPTAPATTAPVAQAKPAPHAKPATPITPGPQLSDNASPQFEGILNSMKKYFEKSMILLFKGNTLEPYAWDQAWTKAAHSQSAIDVSTPSVFRIVNETQHPYHGYIVPNHINDAFFNTWNNGQTPEHITICPIIHEKKIYGMILGATTKDAAKKFQLHHIQEIANDTFAMISSSKAA